MIALFTGGFFSGVSVTLFAIAVLLDTRDRRGGVIRHDTPEARRAIGRPW